MRCGIETGSGLGFKLGAAAGAAMLMCVSLAAQAESMKSYWEFKKPKMITIDGDLSFDTNGAQPPVRNAGSPYAFGFEGVTQFDGASFGRNFIPPDTMGAVGMKQYMETTNGAYAVFDKYTGTRLSLTSDVAFWSAAGQTGANGDSRVMYNADAKRWIVASFGGNTKDLQIAISDTDNALGSWKSVKFEGYAGFGFGATADYPTLALDKNAVYIGTNNFAPAVSGGTNSFRGTTLNVIPLNSLFGAGAPTVNNMKQFVTDYPGTGIDNGFAIQGVNSRSAGSTGRIAAASLYNLDNVAYKVNGLTSSNATGSTTTASQYLNMQAFNSPYALGGRQPSVAIPANRRVIDTLDERISSSVYEVDGRIYMLNTVEDSDFARVRYTVIDADSFAILDQGNIGDGQYDYYQGSIAVNSFGQVVIGYNRSGNQTTDLNGDGFMDGNISFMGRSFETAADGKLVASSDELLLKVSLTDDYHNGSVYGQAAAGRQRWGDYSQVSVDPENEHNFYLVGQFAREYNLPEFGHPGGTGGSRWGTWVAVITTPVPEPGTWAMMVFGLGVVGALAARRRQKSTLDA